MIAAIAAQKKGYYSDGLTKITDAFWEYKCRECGHEGWSLTNVSRCIDCGSTNITSNNPTIKNNPSS